MEQRDNITTNKISGDFSGCGIGAFVNGMENLSSFQNMIGKKLAVVLWYVPWPTSAEAPAAKPNPFPTSEVDLVDVNESIPLITWEPWITHSLGTLEAIASGSYESYVESFLSSAKAWGKPFFLRFAHEMNGNWYPWDGDHNGGVAGPEKYKRAWRYIYNVREKLQASNVNLVWSPNHTNFPDTSWNTVEAYYPGDQYVDWIGMDGYNWGYSSWQSFDQVFSSVYQKLTSLSNKPLMIGEFACATSEGDSQKAQWINDAFSKIKAHYPRIKVFCWFNINKERDWRVNSSSTSQAAFKQAISDSYFVGKID